MNNEFKTKTRSNYICEFVVSDRFRQGSLFRDVFFLFVSNYFSVDDGIYSAEEAVGFGGILYLGNTIIFIINVC